ncbi:hypothetical protein [Methylobacterium sp. CM6247]
MTAAAPSRGQTLKSQAQRGLVLDAFEPELGYAVNEQLANCLMLYGPAEY